MGGGPRYREAGGGPATGLANDFVKFLQDGLNTGSFGGVSATQRLQGSDPIGATAGIAGVLNDILSGGAGKLGGSLNEMISRSINDQAGALRARFGAGGGTAFGTPAAYAEGVLRSQAAPALTNAIGGLQLSALGQILPMIAQIAGRGITQRQGYLQPNQTASTIASLAPFASAGLSLFAPNPLAGLGGAGASTMAAPQLSPLSGGYDLFSANDPNRYNFGIGGR